MFTGIITHTAKVIDANKTANGLRLKIERPLQWKKLQDGESVAVDGVCLTVEKATDKFFEVTLIPETLSKTTFGTKPPKVVNLERSMALGDRLAGHIVSGHVDDTGKVERVYSNGEYRVWFSIPTGKQKYLVMKGSVTVNGVALTVAGLDKHQFNVALIPHTLAKTTLGKLRQGDIVNLEFDMLGKYALDKKGSK